MIFIPTFCQTPLSDSNSADNSQNTKQSTNHAFCGYIYFGGLTKGKMNTRSQHENKPSRGIRSIILHAEDFAFAHEVSAEAWKIQPAVTRWVMMASRMVRCFNDQTRI